MEDGRWEGIPADFRAGFLFMGRRVWGCGFWVEMKGKNTRVERRNIRLRIVSQEKFEIFWGWDGRFSGAA